MDTHAQPVPQRDRMVEAFLARDLEWDGIFDTGVITTQKESIAQPA